MSKTTFDLSTLNLPEGTHTITVKAKADGYRESDTSNAVTYTKAAVSFTNVTANVSIVGTYSVLTNMNTSKVYTVFNSYISAGEVTAHKLEVFRYINGAWTKKNFATNLVQISQSSVKFQCNANLSYYGETTGTVLEGISEATNADAKNYTPPTTNNIVDYFCFIENTLISTKNGDKFVQDISYNDDILVWNFDKGNFDYAKPVFIKQEQTSDFYWNVTDEDGKTVGLVGSDGKSHRLYNKRTRLFEYPQDIPECKCEEIHKSVKYYNIVTAYHFNCFANGILTSKRYSNMLYPITNEMKYDKTVKHMNTCKREQFGFLTDEEFEKLRLSEMEYSDEMCDEVKRFFTLKR